MLPLCRFTTFIASLIEPGKRIAESEIVIDPSALRWCSPQLPPSR
jgi:hypothetical protein